MGVFNQPIVDLTVGVSSDGLEVHDDRSHLVSLSDHSQQPFEGRSSRVQTTLLHCGSCQLEVLEVSISVQDPDISDTANIPSLTLRTEAGGETAQPSPVLSVGEERKLRDRVRFQSLVNLAVDIFGKIAVIQLKNHCVPLLVVQPGVLSEGTDGGVGVNLEVESSV